MSRTHEAQSCQTKDNFRLKSRCFAGCALRKPQINPVKTQEIAINQSNYEANLIKMDLSAIFTPNQGNSPFQFATQTKQNTRLLSALSTQYSTKPLTPRQQELMARSLPKRSPISGVRHIVVVASGKGGVGKSTTAVNLACTMAQMGNRVGLMDADVFGPSIPLMMNVHEEPLVDDRNLMIPVVNYGVKW